MNNRRSQTEIMGLVVIVLLISFMIFFAAIYFLTKEPDVSIDEKLRQQAASNFLSTLLYTTVSDCREGSDISILALLQNCRMARQCDGGVDACQKAEEVTRHILDKTMEEWGDQPYLFVAEPLYDDYSLEIENSCTKAQEGKTMEHSIPMPPGESIRVTMKLCTRQGG